MDVGLGYVHNIEIDDKTETAPATVLKKSDKEKEELKKEKSYKAESNKNLVKPKSANL